MKPNENTERLHDMTQLIKRMSAFLLCLMLLMGAFTETALAAPDWPSGVSVQAESGIVIDADTGTVLWGQNIHNQYFPASITKIMTALIVIEKCSLDETVTFSHNAVFNVEAGSSNAGINEGDKLSVKDCLYALLLKSANESANALAEHVAGSTEAFADMMNAKAKELGCTDTHFANPSGLNNPEHYTSTYDMALIARAAFLNPTFEEIDSTTYYKLPPNSINPEGLTIYPGHKMLKKSTPYYYPGIVESGTKTAKMVKSHHNVGGLPEDLQFQLVEPLRQLFKDEVRACGVELGLPAEMVYRQPFPGPGLGVRCLGAITKERLEAVRESDAILREEFANAGLDKTVWQYFTVVPDFKSVGVRDNARCFDYPVILRAVNTIDAMSASIEQIDYAVLLKITDRILKEVKNVNRVCYDLSPKPTATIEWE